MRERLIHARLLILLMSARVSGELTYRRHVGLSELHRRLVTLIGDYGGLTSVELVALTGQEKAQISRAVKSLSQAGLIERTSLRAPIRLSAGGRAEFARILEVGRARNQALVEGIAPEALARFEADTLRLTERAAMLLADERALSEAAGTADVDCDEPRLSEAEPPPLPEHSRLIDPERPLARMVVPPLMALVSYLQRSATIAYRRETNLSNFGWSVLSQIGEHQPITLASLIALIARDKSQIGRAVRKLEESGQVERSYAPGRRDIVLTTTDKGARTYALMCADALRRDDYLFADFSPEERAAYVGVIETITTNAAALLAAERAR